MDRFCELLKELRAKRNWSQEDLARRVGVSLSTIQRWENSRCLPSRVLRRDLNRLFQEMGFPDRFGMSGGGLGPIRDGAVPIRDSLGPAGEAF